MINDAIERKLEVLVLDNFIPSQPFYNKKEKVRDIYNTEIISWSDHL